MAPPRMTAWPVPANPRQLQLRTLVMGAGTPYGVQAIDGLDLPAMHTADSARAGGDGSFGGLDISPSRPVILHLVVHPDLVVAGATKAQLLRDLKAAFAESSVDIGFTLQDPDLGALLVMGRPRRCSFSLDLTAPWRSQEGVLAMFEGLDPLLYSALVHDVVLPYATAGVNAGLPFNSASFIGATARPGPAPSGSTYQGFTFGAIGGGAGASGFASVTNAGNAPSAPVTTFYGPSTGPLVIEHIETGEVITINLNLGAADSLELDHDLHTVTLNGVTNRQDAVDISSNWWVLPPGVSTVHYRTFGQSPGSSADFRWRDAWW